VGNIDHEVAQRQKRARKLMNNKGFNALVLATGENIQYLTGVTEASIHQCGVVIVSRQTQPILGVMWLDKKAAQEQAKEVMIKVYTPHSLGKVVTRTIERLGIAKGTIGIDDRALHVFRNSFRRSLPHAEFVNASITVQELRWVKSEQEIRFIQKACEIADQGMQVALESVEPGITELQIAALAESRMMKLGSDRMKHRTIVASGPRAGFVHPFATQKKIVKGDIVAIDIGAVYHGYCSDIARTAVVERTSEELKDGFNALRNAQDVVLQKLCSGVSMQQIDAVARGAIKPSKYHLIGHVGHSIGLIVEEYPWLMTRGTPYPDTTKLKKNMVVAFLQSSIRSKRCFGIRLEDTAVITESGGKMLTSYPRELF